MGWECSNKTIPNSLKQNKTRTLLVDDLYKHVSKPLREWVLFLLQHLLRCWCIFASTTTNVGGAVASPLEEPLLQRNCRHKLKSCTYGEGKSLPAFLPFLASIARFILLHWKTHGTVKKEKRKPKKKIYII